MRIAGWMALLGMVALGSSCATGPGARREPLRIGVTANYPPLVFMRGPHVVGAEADLAVQLGADLGRPVQWVFLPWERLLGAVEAGEVDVGMAGLSVTRAREARVAFGDAYVENPLVAVVRRGEAGQYATAADVRGAGGNVGFMQGTAADAYVRQNVPGAKPLAIVQREDAAFQLSNRRLDAYVDDLAAAIHLVAANEARLEIVPVALEAQQLAWAVRPDDPELLRRSNEALARWRADGLLEQMLDRWMPYRKTVAAAP
jgi:polar amino acid transport system substrate-binding protein